MKRVHESRGLRLRQNSLLPQHPGVRKVNFEERIQEVALCVFEVRAENGRGIDGRWKRVGCHARIIIRRIAGAACAMEQ
jgi:hypothetical protein